MKYENYNYTVADFKEVFNTIIEGLELAENPNISDARLENIYKNSFELLRIADNQMNKFFIDLLNKGAE